VSHGGSAAGWRLRRGRWAVQSAPRAAEAASRSGQHRARARFL